MTKNWIYCRVSSEKQSDYLNGHTSLEVQQNTVYEFAEKYGVNIEHCYYDICSARNMAKQYYLNELLKIVSQGDSIYFYDVSRFSRNTKDALNCLDNLASRNITVFSIIDDCGYNSFAEKNMFRVLLSKAENESDLISERVKKSIKFRRERGDYIGSAPYGYKAIKNKKGIRVLTINKDEKCVIDFVKKLHYDNTSNFNIAVKLNEIDIKKRGIGWSANMVKNLINKHLASALTGFSSLKSELNKVDKKRKKKVHGNNVDDDVDMVTNSKKKKKKYNFRK
jgi:site-specific DNA recombinase